MASVRPKEPENPTQKTKKKKRNRGKKLTLDTFSASLAANCGPKTTKAAKTVAGFGFNDGEVLEAIRRMRDSGEAITFDSLIDTAYVVQKDFLEKEVLESSSRRTGHPLPDSDDASNKEQLRGEDADLEDEDDDDDDEEEEVTLPESTQKDVNLKLKKAIEKRKESLRAAIDAMTFTCRLCHCAKATILLLPCGHLASCDDCLMDVRRCPIARCNKIVRGTKEVFFV